MRRYVMALLLIASLAIPSPAIAYDGCYSVPVTTNTPTGIAGCQVWGDGIASYYSATGMGVAMNFCTWKFRHQNGCGYVTITAMDTGKSVTAPVVDFCDCYTGTSRQRIVDLQGGVVVALGLSKSKGLYHVNVSPAFDNGGPVMPDTAMSED